MKEVARELVQYHIKAGNIIRLPCLICQEPKTDAHHLYGYSKENSLKVAFLCRKHHFLADHDPEFNEKIKVLVTKKE
jgi:hypothetical protein